MPIPGHRCDVYILGKLSDDCNRFVKNSQNEIFRKFLLKSEWSDRFQPGKILKIIKHVGYSIKYYKISLLIYTLSSSLSHAGPFY